MDQEQRTKDKDDQQQSKTNKNEQRQTGTERVCGSMPRTFGGHAGEADATIGRGRAPAVPLVKLGLGMQMDLDELVWTRRGWYSTADL